MTTERLCLCFNSVWKEQTRDSTPSSFCLPSNLLYSHTRWATFLAMPCSQDLSILILCAYVCARARLAPYC